MSLAADLPAYKTNVVEKVRTVVGGSISTGIVTRAIDAVDHQEMLEDELKLAPAKLPEATETPPDPNTKVIVAKTKDQSNAIKWSELTILTAPLTQIALTFLYVVPAAAIQGPAGSHRSCHRHRQYE